MELQINRKVGLAHKETIAKTHYLLQRVQKHFLIRQLGKMLQNLVL